MSKECFTIKKEKKTTIERLTQAQDNKLKKKPLFISKKKQPFCRSLKVQKLNKKKDF